MDSTLFCTETGFSYPVDREKAVRRTLQFVVEHPDILGESPDYALEDRLIKSYYSKIGQIHSEVISVESI